MTWSIPRLGRWRTRGGPGGGRPASPRAAATSRLQRDWAELRAGSAPIEDRLDQRLGEYWVDRVRIHIDDSYASVPMMKFPEDLRVYEHLLWDSRATAVIELGSYHGGSALWFRDRLLSLARYHAGARVRVISIDLDCARARANVAAADPSFDKEIVLLEGDVRDPGLVDAVRARLPDGARCLVVEDSGHTAETTAAALRNFAEFVPPLGYLVVEDGSVDIEAMRVFVDWPRGVLPAVDEWLRTDQGSEFERRRDLERYILTSHPRGFLQRTGRA